jgi:hypothetical protein
MKDSERLLAPKEITQKKERLIITIGFNRNHSESNHSERKDSKRKAKQMNHPERKDSDRNHSERKDLKSGSTGRVLLLVLRKIEKPDHRSI